MDLRVSHPFEPIVFKDTKILILGTFPSIDSCKKSFYYSHPRNQFWKILSEITNYPINTKEQKIALLKLKRWGVWDMVASCSRENSLDSSLKSVKVNDIPKFLQEHKSIKKILFTGRKAQELFEKNFKELDIERDYLPSPSPAYAGMSFDEKAKIYAEKLL